MTVEDNELLVRVGPGTAMGNLFRRFWLPVMLVSEVEEPDGPPVRLRQQRRDRHPRCARSCSGTPTAVLVRPGDTHISSVPGRQPADTSRLVAQLRSPRIFLISARKPGAMSARASA